MRKFSPTLLVALFGIAVAMRVGYFSYEYYGDIFIAKAAENKPNSVEVTKNPVDKIETINDKIFKKEIKKINNASFASKESGKSDIDNPKKVCITGHILKETIKKIAYLDAREAEIMEQQRLLETSDRRVREQVAKLKLIKEEIVESAKLADATINKESKRLISIYEKMKPKDAANIFNEMLPSVAAELLRTMKEDQSAQILSKMNPKNAYDITLSLAGGIEKTKEKYDTIQKE